MNTVRRLGLLIAACVAWTSAGCAVRTPADPHRLSSAEVAAGRADVAWPVRYPELLTGSHPGEAPDGEAADGVCELLALDDERLSKRFGLDVTGRNLGRYGEGVVHEMHATRPGQIMPSGRPAQFASLYLFRSATISRDELQERIARLGIERAIATAGHASFLALYEPDPPRPARGLVVHLTGLIGVGPERPVLHELRRRGWAVLVVAPPADDLVNLAGILVESTTELLYFEVAGDPADAGKDECTQTVVERASRDLARDVDNHLAQWAYAVEAVLACLREHRPDVPQEPMAVVGYSLGALALPAVVARSPEAFDAAVLVTGGADILRISRLTSLHGFGIKLLRGGEPLSAAEWEAVHRGYLAATRLDPYQAALALAGRPVLMLHGLFDTIVPASAGNAMYERLGRPERWTYFGGHAMVFWLLPTQADRIADWLERAVWRVRQHGMTDAERAAAQR